MLLVASSLDPSIIVKSSKTTFKIVKNVLKTLKMVKNLTIDKLWVQLSQQVN